MIFTLKNMSKTLDEILEEYISSTPSQVELTLPKLKKTKTSKSENKNGLEKLAISACDIRCSLDSCELLSSKGRSCLNKLNRFVVVCFINPRQKCKIQPIKINHSRFFV